MASTDIGIALPDRYRVISLIARGGMGSVWLAEDRTLGRRVAVKVLFEHIAADPSSVTRFAREARAAAKVSGHPNVATIYDVGEHDGVPYIVIEYFAGGSVAGRLETGAITRSQALTWLAQTAAALDYAHVAGIVHRDVKPANLLLDDRDRVAVADFGIARMLEDTSLTQTGQVLGSVGYLSPEQVGGSPATDASDRYALAVVAFELLAGHRPFQADNAAAQAMQHAKAERPPSGLGGRVDAVLHRGLAKEPQARHLTATLFVDELRHALQGGAAAATEATRAVPRQRALRGGPTPAAGIAVRATSDRRRRPRLAAVAAAAALVLAGGLAALLAAGSGDSDRRSASQLPARTEAQQKPQQRRTNTAETRPAREQGAGSDSSAAPAAAGATGESPSALNDRGFAILASNPAGAIPVLEASVKGFEAQGQAADRIRYGYALYNLGQAYLRTGRPADAVASFQRRLAVSPSDRPGVVRNAIAEAKRRLGTGNGAAGGDSAAKTG